MMNFGDRENLLRFFQEYYNFEKENMKLERDMLKLLLRNCAEEHKEHFQNYINNIEQELKELEEEEARTNEESDSLDVSSESEREDSGNDVVDEAESKFLKKN
ncbi:uncharacterized protein LOC109594457 [Aethina tumida]|uniref:uncharacterized protein LOC109594457 n=1 Tax=Aethina tumida TaxID=116153 RepID=UPI00096AE0D7|nr:uncharacterized protein LOC109594457 [Aethina tumida]